MFPENDINLRYPSLLIFVYTSKSSLSSKHIYIYITPSHHFHIYE